MINEEARVRVREDKEKALKNNHRHAPRDPLSAPARNNSKDLDRPNVQQLFNSLQLPLLPSFLSKLLSL